MLQLGEGPSWLCNTNMDSGSAYVVTILQVAIDRRVIFFGSIEDNFFQPACIVFYPLNWQDGSMFSCTTLVHQDNRGEYMIFLVIVRSQCLG